MSWRVTGNESRSARPFPTRSCMCSKKDPTFCSAVVRPSIRSKECSRDIASEMMPDSSRPARGSEAASVSIRKTGYRAMIVSAVIASAVKACVPRTPKPKKSPGSKRSTVCRRPSARRANRLAAPEITRYQHSTDPSCGVDLFVTLIPRHHGERLQHLRYRSRARGPLVRPHLLARPQVSSIGVHFSPSIVCPAAEWLCFYWRCEAA